MKKITSIAAVTLPTLALLASIGASANAHAATLPNCQSASSDSDGDGFGWENNKSCRVVADNIPTSSTRDTCQSASSDPDGDGWGWENGKSCRVASGNPTPTTPSSSSRPDCVSPSADPDGDGWGWENGKSCRVSNQTQPSTPSTPSTALSNCQSASSDPDGDGFGWEDGKSCRVVAGQPSTPTTGENFKALSPTGVLSTGTPTFKWNALSDAEMYTLAIADGQGNGYSYDIDPVRAGCQAGGECAATPDLAYYDNDLTWRVIPTLNGQRGESSNRLAITTPGNANVQPVKSGQCEAWPSVKYDKYIVLNNSWNSRAMNNSNWEQKIHVSEDNDGNVTPSWTYDWLGQFDGGEIDVKAYPEVLYGPKLGTHVSGSKAETGLPEKVKDLPEFKVEYAYRETGSGAERNVALESFFHDSCNIAGPCDPVDNRAYEMMIWVDNPTTRTPGDLALTGVMIDNRLWNVYIKPRSNKHYIAFTAQNPQSSGTINWKRFVDWTQQWTTENSARLQIDALSPEFCMGAIEIGTEMWWGAGTFALDRFKVTF